MTNNYTIRVDIIYYNDYHLYRNEMHIFGSIAYAQSYDRPFGIYCTSILYADMMINHFPVR